MAMYRVRKIPAQTQQEWDDALKQLAAVVKTNITQSGSDPNDTLLILVYGTGLMRVKFPSGNVLAAQGPNVEHAIEVGRECAIEFALAENCAIAPYIEVHRVPANCKGIPEQVEWLKSIGMEVTVVPYDEPNATALVN